MADEKYITKLSVDADKYHTLVDTAIAASAIVYGSPAQQYIQYEVANSPAAQGLAAEIARATAAEAELKNLLDSQGLIIDSQGLLIDEAFIEIAEQQAYTDSESARAIAREDALEILIDSQGLRIDDLELQLDSESNRAIAREDDLEEVINSQGLRIDALEIEKQIVLTAGEGIELDSAGNISAPHNAYNYINQTADYLFETQYSTAEIDYDFANEYFKGATADELEGLYGYCTGVLKNSQVLRHFDYFYNDTVEFIVRRPADKENKIYGNIGVAGGFRDLCKADVEAHSYNEKYKLVPFAMADGINDQGLYIQQNVVPLNGLDYNIGEGNPVECCINMVSRYILDNCANFADVENALTNKLHIYKNPNLDFGIHFLIAKDNDWRVIEFTNNGFEIVGPTGTSGVTSTMPHGIMTNFRTTDLTFDSTDNIQWDSIEEYGLGVERFEIGQTVFNASATLQSIRPQLMYSHLYDDAVQTWRTEESGSESQVVAGHKLTVLDSKDSTYDADYVRLFAEDKANWAAKTREDGKGVWHTVHSCIYDLANKSFNIMVQENQATSFDFALDDILTPRVDVLESNLASEISRATASEATITSNLTSEISSRQTADSNLQTQIDAKIDDVTVNGTSIVDSSGVAVMPITSTSKFGLVKLKSWNEGNINNDGNGTIYLTPQTQAQITARNNGNGIINAGNIDIAVKSALTDASGITVPSTAGTYTLKAVVDASGNITLQWE